MHDRYKARSSLFATAAVALALVLLGCVARLRVYDDVHRDYHYWDSREDRAYRHYWQDRHEDYREFSRLNDDQQREYWKWRHNHAGADRD